MYHERWQGGGHCFFFYYIFFYSWIFSRHGLAHSTLNSNGCKARSHTAGDRAEKSKRVIYLWTFGLFLKGVTCDITTSSHSQTGRTPEAAVVRQLLYSLQEIAKERNRSSGWRSSCAAHRSR